MAMHRPRYTILLLAIVSIVFAWHSAPADEDFVRPPGYERVQQLIDDVQYEAAIEAAQALVVECDSDFGKESFEVASACDLLAKAMKVSQRANEPEALEAAQRAVAIKEKLFDGVHRELGISVHMLGVVLLDQGQRETAEEQLKRALAMRRELGIAEDTAATVGVLAIVAATGGRPDEAQTLFEEALELSLQAYGPDHEQVGRAHRNLGILYRIRGNSEAAEHHLQRALDIAEAVNGPDHPQVADAASSLAGLQLKLADYGPARENFERALRIHKATLPPTSTRIAAQYEGLGLIAMLLGDNDAAADYLNQCVAIYEASDPGASADFRAALANLGVVEVRRGHYEAARQAFERTLALREETAGPRSATTAEALAWLGFSEAKLGDTERAIPRLEQAVAILDSTSGPGNSTTGDALRFLGVAYEGAGRLDDALAAYDRAIAAEEAERGEGQLLATKLIHRGTLYQRRGAFPLAMADALRAEDLAREHYQHTAQTLTEREAREFAVARTEGMDLALSALLAGEDRATAITDVWDLVLRSRSLILEELLERRRAVLRAETPELAAMAQAVSQARRELAALYVKGPGDDDAAFEAALEAARKTKNDAERDLARESAGFRRWRQATSTGFADLSGLLAPDQGLVAYVRYQWIAPPADPVAHYAAFLLRAGTARVYDLGDAASLETLIERWRATIEDGRMESGPIAAQARDRCRRVGAELRAKVWDPLADQLAGLDLVFVVPDGDLHLVPMMALPDDDGGWLVEHSLLMHVLGAERQLAVAYEEPPNQDLLAIGAPDFDRASNEPRTFELAAHIGDDGLRGVRPACADFREMTFAPLSGAQRECEEIATVWQQHGSGRAQVLTAERATEGAFKRSASGHRVLHLATHGYFMGQGCTSESILEDHPLLLSGLALAGVNRRQEASPDEEDGVLTAEEIALLDLDGVEWAVLSACDTGGGAILSGEGVYGLRRAFEVAGARTVIMSLWSVDDEATRDWMRTLYTARFGAGRSTPEAMREASRHILDARRQSGRSDHPFWWASFVAVGDWR